jgi:hypothetical protein
MGRPNYMSLYADERTQNIFDEFCRIKGITKTTALTEILDIYMLSQDEELYTELKKKALGIESARQMIAGATDVREVNDYVFMKLATAYDLDGNLIPVYLKKSLLYHMIQNRILPSYVPYSTQDSTFHH